MQGRSISNTPGSHAITEAVEHRNWPAARFALAKRLAEAADATDSARDLKSLARSIAPLLDRCEIDEARAEASSGDTPLARILAEAQAQDGSVINF